jgi:hypothetical protein
MMPRINRKANVAGVPSPRRLQKDAEKHPNRKNTRGKGGAGRKQTKGDPQPQVPANTIGEADREDDAPKHIDIMV